MAKPQNQTAVNSKVLPGVIGRDAHGDSFSFVHFRKQHWLRTFLGAFTFGVLASIVTTTPVRGAERIEFSYPPFGDFDISTDSLEVFAKEGKITDEFAFYAKRLKPQQLFQLRYFLKTRFQVTPTLVSQFTYSAIGENLLQRMGELLQTQSRQNGFYALRSAFILSAADSEGLTVVNLLRRYPSPSVRLNLSLTQQTLGNLSEMLKKRDAIVGALKQVAEAEAANQPKTDFSQQPDLRRPGAFSWQKTTLTLDDSSRSRRLDVDLHLPQLPQRQTETKTQNTLSPPIPVIVISHGIAEDRETYTYVAQHLASHGFAVAVLQHPGSDTKRFQEYFAGFASPPEPKELLDRPLDVKFVLDQLQRLSESDPTLKGQLNLQQVGVIGHSLGGYTALTLAGATINFEQIRKDCNPNRSLNLSVFLQCRAGELPPASYPLLDQRIKAVIALNPSISTILGQRGLSQIQVPVMLVGGSQDIFTPVVPEQILPFTWLQTPNKYLVLIENGTHFSTAETSNPAKQVLPVTPKLIGPNPAIAHSYVNALSLAFFQTYLSNRQEYRPYLSASYAKFISQAPLNLDLVQSFTLEQLGQIFNRKSPPSATSSKGQPTPKTP